MNIINLPEDGYNYEFIVVVPYPNMEHLHCTGCFKDGFEAEQCALQYEDAYIIHNVRIQGYKKQKEKLYVFSGTWSWSCEATSEEEAKEKFNDCNISEIDMDYNYYEIKELGN